MKKRPEELMSQVMLEGWPCTRESTSELNRESLNFQHSLCLDNVTQRSNRQAQEKKRRFNHERAVAWTGKWFQIISVFRWELCAGSISWNSSFSSLSSLPMVDPRFSWVICQLLREAVTRACLDVEKGIETQKWRILDSKSNLSSHGIVT
jgi:hypothetical protein